MTDQNKAAPAPSSLAGGEVSVIKAIEGLLYRHCPEFGLDERQKVAATEARAIHAALSPEAPARIETPIDALCTALTPRHEAPACPHDAYETDSAGQPVRCSDCHEAPAEPCKSCNGTGRELGSAFNRCSDCEAPAEGAGDAGGIPFGGAEICAELRRRYPSAFDGSDRLGNSPPRLENATDLYLACCLAHLRARSPAPEARDAAD